MVVLGILILEHILVIGLIFWQRCIIQALHRELDEARLQARIVGRNTLPR